MKLRFLVDFNSVDDSKNRIEIREHTALLKRVNSENLRRLKVGSEITLFDLDGLEIDAVAGFDEQNQYWYGTPDWSTRGDSIPPSTENEE